MLFSLQKLPYGFVAALTGVMAFPLPSQAAEAAATTENVVESASAPTPAAAEDPTPVAPAPAEGDDDTSNQEATANAGSNQEASVDQDDDGQADSCMVKTICAVKQKIRWMTPAWTPQECQRIANAIESSSKQHDLQPDAAARDHDQRERHEREGVPGLLVARRQGLREGRRVDGNPLTWSTTKIIVSMAMCAAWPGKTSWTRSTNIEVGARELAYWRDGGGITSRTIKPGATARGTSSRSRRTAPAIT